MNTASNSASQVEPIAVSHVIKGQLQEGAALSYRSAGVPFVTAALDLDQLVWPRALPGPAFDTPLAEIIDVLAATSTYLKSDPDGLLAQALDRLVPLSTLPRELLARSYAGLWAQFQRRTLEFQVEQELGGADVLDGWREVPCLSGRAARVRAFPPRLVHVLAGNAPGVAALSIARGALTKGVHLLKLPSNDLFSATAILRAIAAVAPGHALTRSFSAAYWRGGDEAVESALFRPQFFDKLVAWGGERSIRSAQRYIGPGFELVSFDPKTSVSLIGREAFTSAEHLAEAATLAAADAAVMNQQACVSSRFQFIEGDATQIDQFCAALQRQLGCDGATRTAVGTPVPADLAEEIETLGLMGPDYQVWGAFDGSGLVIRSAEPVDFYPDGKIVNVVPIAHLADAMSYITVATQTVGVYPSQRKMELRDELASRGVQRVVSLGKAAGQEVGLPHDGFYPLQRFVRWVNDED